MNIKHALRHNGAAKLLAIVLTTCGFGNELRAEDPEISSSTQTANSLDQQIFTVRQAIQRLEKEVDKQRAIHDRICSVPRDPRFKFIPLNAYDRAVNEEIREEAMKRYRAAEAVGSKLESLNSQIDELYDLIRFLKQRRAVL